MSQPTAQTIIKQGTTITKEKLMEMIKNSKEKQFPYISENNSKNLIVVLTSR